MPAALGAVGRDTTADGSPVRTEPLLGADAVRVRLAELDAAARTQLLVVVPDDRPDRQPPAEDALARGVEVRALYLDSARAHRPTLDHAQHLVRLGGQVRTATALPIRMTVVDRHTAVLPLDPDRPDTAAVLHGRGPVAALCALFEQLWQGAAPLSHARGRDGNGMTAQHYALLRILRSGDTDVVAARKLGVSDRTVRRLTAEALEVLGARSRFQAGARAAERGWLH
ncbi:hypothetical protein [Streptomyces sp. TLI_171]|uniref:hypothetical protein n=1 Tax=Streptomyces sp. TLI_171 TaxID=1938859 RepID=UPI000C176BDF|nr:hypothetical protein [Streptomyces sp. TLI_171]RKE21903.1 hypothetical protein BX266_5309 [Streptomyces sp. TLI_171]